MIDGVPQERRRTVNPLRGKSEFLANKTVKVNPNGGKQGGIPKKESPGITNNKSDPNGPQKELVPRRPRVNSNKNPRRSNYTVPAEAKGDPRREIPFEFYAQVRSEQAQKVNKFLSACRNFLYRVRFLRRSKLEQKGNHSEASAREICSSGIILGTVQLLHRSKQTSQRWIKNPEFETMKENIQLTRLDQDISQINPESRINLGSPVNPEN